MIQITKYEKKYLESKIKYLQCSRTVHKYYVPETEEILKALQDYKNINKQSAIVETVGEIEKKKGVSHG